MIYENTVKVIKKYIGGPVWNIVYDLICKKYYYLLFEGTDLFIRT
jgi:hypothetical protein